MWIERATADDADEIRDVCYQSWRAAYGEIFTPDFINEFFSRNFTNERLLSSIASPDDIFLVARDGTPIAAIAHAGIREAGTTLFRLYALPDYWRSGVGSELLNTVETELRVRGVEAYHCFVLSENEIGKGFYRKQGFVRVPERDHDDEWGMEKRLSAPPRAEVPG